MIEQDVLDVSGDWNSQENYGKVTTVHRRNKACITSIFPDFKYEKPLLKYIIHADLKTVSKLYWTRNLELTLIPYI